MHGFTNVPLIGRTTFSNFVAGVLAKQAKKEAAAEALSARPKRAKPT
jgi:hypothetical protein